MKNMLTPVSPAEEIGATAAVLQSCYEQLALGLIDLGKTLSPKGARENRLYRMKFRRMAGREHASHWLLKRVYREISK